MAANVVDIPSSPVYASWILPTIIGLNALSLLIQKRLLTLSAILINTFLMINVVTSNTFQVPERQKLPEALGFGAHISTLTLRGFSWLVFDQPQGKMNLVRTSADGSKTSITSFDSLPLWKRCLRGVEACFAARQIGWTNQVTKVPRGPPPSYPRGKFLLQSSANLLVWYLLMDAGVYMIRTSALGQYPFKPDLFEMPLPYGVLFAWASFMTGSWAMMGFLYELLLVITVALHIYDPVDWPPWYGSFKDSWTVRRFWALFWHQGLRSATEPSLHYLIHNVLHIKRGTYMSNYSKVFGAFFYSSVIHMWGAMIAFGKERGEWNFFMSQAVAIWVEEHALTVAKLLGIQGRDKRWRWLGYLWTFGFMTWSLIHWVNLYGHAGFWTAEPLPFSLTDLIVTKLGLKSFVRWILYSQYHRG